MANRPPNERNTSGGQPQVHEVIRGQPQSHEVIRGQPSLIQEVRGQRVHDVRGQQQVHEVRGQQQVHEVSSPYKRPRTQSPVASAAHPSGPGYPYSQQAAVPEGARYSQAPTPEGARYTMPVGSHPGAFDPSALYVRPHLYQAGAPAPHPSASSAAEHVPDYRDHRYREMEMPPRRRPSMLNDYNSHAIALEREREREKFDREQAQRMLQSHHQSQQHHQQAAVAAAAQQAAQQGQELVTHSGYKKSRIMEVRPDLAQPLRIDTRVDSDKRMTVNLTDNLPTTYTPQVEAISPTLPSEDKADEVSNIKSSKAKDELLQNIKKVDREIAELETQIGKLKKKQQQLEEQANKPPEERSNTPENENRNQSIAQIIYAENRKKAAEAHAQLDKLAPKIEMENGCLPLGFNIMSMFPIQPLYNQPSDTAVYHENKRRHMSFKKRLMLSFKKKHQSQRIREKYLTERYDQLLQQWVKKVERIENTTKRRAKDAKTREYFEKVFPELKKQRVDKESFIRNRGLGVVKSDAEMEQIIDGLHEAEEEEKKMRSYAVIPPMLLDARQRKLRFHNNNGLVEDPKTEHKENQNINVWTDQEKDVFRDKFLVHPKDFGFIAAHLERKSVQDCVQYYYLSKKNENYKQLVKKMNVKKKRIPKASISQSDMMRLREQNKLMHGDVKKEDEEESVPIIHPDDKKGMDCECNKSTPSSISSLSSNGSNIVTSTSNQQPITSVTSGTAIVKTEDGIAGEQVQSTALVESTTCEEDKKEGILDSSTGNLINKPVTKSGEQIRLMPDSKPVDEVECQEGVGQEVSVGVREIKQETDAEDKFHNCAVCKNPVSNFSQSRLLNQSHCHLYTISANSWTPDMRVCDNCRFRRVHERRYTPCPVPTCKNPKRRVKRLRPLPLKLQELSPEKKESIFMELQLNPDIARCCSACFNRIARKMGNNPNTNEPLVQLVQEEETQETPRWTEEEMEVAKQCLRNHGRDWAMMSKVVGTKSEPQCKNFYFNYKKKFNLDALLMEYKIRKGEDKRKVSMCESVASTISADHPSEDEQISSDDDDNGEDNDISETDSAPSPAPPPLGTGDNVNAPLPLGSAGDLIRRPPYRPASSHTVPQGQGPNTGDGGQRQTVISDQAGATTQEKVESNLVQGIQKTTTEGYDSSATLSADEGPSQGESQVDDPTSHHHHHHQHRPPDSITGHLAVGSSSHKPIEVLENTRDTRKLRPSSTQPFQSYSGPDLGTDRPASMPGQGDPVRRAQPCVRDLIHSAIEKNIQRDVCAPSNKITKMSAEEAIRRDLASSSTTSMSHHPTSTGPHMAPPSSEHIHHEGSHPRVVPHPIPSRPHSGSGISHVQQHREGLSSQPIMREMKITGQPEMGRRSAEIRDRSETYRGDPMAYDPLDPRYGVTGYKRLPNDQAAPPPAHSHHRSHPDQITERTRSPSASGMLGQQPTPSAPGVMWTGQVSGGSPHYVLAQPPQPERRGPLPPSSLADVVPRSSHQVPGGRAPPIGHPPPLINIDGKGGERGRASPVPSPRGYQPHHAGGSITQGIPAQHTSPQAGVPRSSAGSISMGTPRIGGAGSVHDPHHQYHHSQGAPKTTPHPSPRPEMGGSITQGTPIAFEHPGTRGGPPGSNAGSHHGGKPQPYMDMRGGQFEQMYKQQQMSPHGKHGATVSSSGGITPVQATAYLNQNTVATEMQSRATLMGDFLTAQQMKEDRRTSGEHDKPPQHSPRAPPHHNEQALSRPPPPQQQQPPQHLPFPHASILDPRQAYETAFSNQQGLLYVQYPGQQVPDQRRSSPIPNQALSPAEQERERMLKNAVEMRGKMPHHWPQAQQPQSKMSPVPQHSPGIRPPPVSSHHRTQTPPAHRSVIMEVPQSHVRMMEQQQQQQGRGLPPPHSQQQMRDSRLPVSQPHGQVSSGDVIVTGSSAGPSRDQQGSGTHAMVLKDVHHHQSNEQIQFLEKQGGGSRREYKHHEKAQEKQMRKFIEQSEHPRITGTHGQRPPEGMPSPYSGYQVSSGSNQGDRQQQQQLPSHHRSNSDSVPNTNPGHHNNPTSLAGAYNLGADRNNSTPTSSSNTSSGSTQLQQGNFNNSNVNKNGDPNNIKTFTAASLIDIIITNQINSSPSGNGKNVKGGGSLLGKLEENIPCSSPGIDRDVRSRGSVENGPGTASAVKIPVQKIIERGPAGVVAPAAHHVMANNIPARSSQQGASSVPGPSPDQYLGHRSNMEKTSPYKQPSQHIQQQNRFEEQIATMTKRAYEENRGGHNSQDRDFRGHGREVRSHAGGEVMIIPHDNHTGSHLQGLSKEELAAQGMTVAKFGQYPHHMAQQQSSGGSHHPIYVQGSDHRVPDPREVQRPGESRNLDSNRPDLSRDIRETRESLHDHRMKDMRHLDQRDIRGGENREQQPHRPHSGSGIPPAPQQSPLRGQPQYMPQHYQQQGSAPVPGTTGYYHQGQRSPEDNKRLRSNSMGAMIGAKLKRALQKEADIMMRGEQPPDGRPLQAPPQRGPMGPHQVPPAQPARSPVILPSDERTIVKVQRHDTSVDVHSTRSPQTGSVGHLMDRQVQAIERPGHERKSPAPGSMAEGSSKPSSPRSPRGSQPYPHHQTMPNVNARTQVHEINRRAQGAPADHMLSPMDVLNEQIVSAINNERHRTLPHEENSRDGKLQPPSHEDNSRDGRLRPPTHDETLRDSRHRPLHHEDNSRDGSSGPESSKVSESDSRFYPMIPSNSSKLETERLSSGGRTPTHENAQQKGRDFLRARYYRETSPRKEGSEQGGPNGGNGMARKSPMSFIYPQTSRDSQGSGGSPTSRPASRSSQPGVLDKQQPPQQGANQTSGQNMVPSPVSAEAQAYRYSPRARHNMAVARSQAETNSASPYAGTPQPSPGGGNRSSHLPPVQSPHGSNTSSSGGGVTGGNEMYTRSNSGGSSNASSPRTSNNSNLQNVSSIGENIGNASPNPQQGLLHQGQHEGVGGDNNRGNQQHFRGPLSQQSSGGSSGGSRDMSSYETAAQGGGGYRHGGDMSNDYNSSSKQYSRSEPPSSNQRSNSSEANTK